MCHGNIWRSPYAAAVLRRELARIGRESVQVSSAGLIGPGRLSPEGAVAEAARRGIDLSGHRSRVVTPGDVAAADLVVVMDTTQERAVRARQQGAERMILLLGDLDPEPVDMRAIPDPDGQPPEVCQASYTRLDRCVRELVSLLPPPATTLLSSIPIANT